MKVALAIVCSEKLDDWQPSALPFNKEDKTIVHVPVKFFNGNINDIRKQLHVLIDTLCDRSVTFSDLDADKGDD